MYGYTIVTTKAKSLVVTKNLLNNALEKMQMNTNINDPMEINPADLKIEFAPGCFDNFDGTQEELDELIAEITRMVKSGELGEQSRALDPEDPEDAELIEQVLASTDGTGDRSLQ
jgi:hypothetical protein